MDAVLQSLQATADQRTKELTEVRKRIERWGKYDELLDNFSIPVPEPPASIDVGVRIPANELRASLAAMTADVQAKLAVEKTVRQTIVDANLRVEKDSMLLNQWISANVKKYDRLLDQIQIDRKFVAEMRQTIVDL